MFNFQTEQKTQELGVKESLPTVTILSNPDFWQFVTRESNAAVVDVKLI